MAQATKAQKVAAAHARAARWFKSPDMPELPDNNDGEEPLTAMWHDCIDSDVDDDDCGYTGGVNICLDSEWEGDMGESDEWSDTESLAELEGEELEANLQALRPKLLVTNPVEVMMPYEEIRCGKSAQTFANAEKNCRLGYNGLSKHTKQLHNKKARDGAATRQWAQNS
jgi:hypothetical protein